MRDRNDITGRSSTQVRTMRIVAYLSLGLLLGRVGTGLYGPIAHLAVTDMARLLWASYLLVLFGLCLAGLAYDIRHWPRSGPDQDERQFTMAGFTVLSVLFGWLVLGLPLLAVGLVLTA